MGGGGGGGVHSQEQCDIFWQETFCLEDIKDCSVVYRIEGILDVEVQDE